MKKNTILFSSFLFFLSLIFLNIFLNSCASPNSPTGGAKDTIAPIIKKSIPEHQDLQYKGKILVLFFSEEVKTKNLNQELLATPPLPSYKLKEVKNRIEIRFDESLKDSTTYSLNFRGGIVDLTEGNVALSANNKTLRLAFSTWNQIDSMSIEGNVTQRLDEKVVEDAVIALYPTDDTLEVNEDKPYYFTLTDEAGNFRIENIKVGEYKVYAIQDANQNYYYDEGEAIGFLTENLVLKDSSRKNLEFKIATEDHTPPEITRSRTKNEYFEIYFDEGLQDVYVDSTKTSKKYAYNLLDKGKTLRFYNTKKFFEDTLAVNIIALDSLGNRLETVDSIYFKKLSEKEEKRRKKEQDKNPSKTFNPNVKLNSGSGIDKNTLDLSITFDLPVQTSNLNNIRFFPDQDTLNTQALFASKNEYEWNQYNTELSIKKEVSFKENLNVLVDSVAFITIENDTSQYSANSFKRKQSSKFGTIGGNVKTDKANYIIQIVNEQWKVMQEAINPKKFKFEFLPAAKYSLRVIIDTNGNGKWDSSDYKNNIPAEEILFFYKNEKLRENWELPDRNIEF